MGTRQIPGYDVVLFTSKKKEHAVCIPVINEGERIRNQLKRMYEMKIHETADIIICDGGSEDGSLESSFLKKFSVSALLIKTGKGRLSAQLRMGYSFALDRGYQYIVTIDGNNKDDPGAIPDMINQLSKGFDFIQGSRFIRGGKGIHTPIFRKISIRFVHAPVISLLSGYRFTDTTNGFRAYRSMILEDPRLNIFRDVFEGYELLAYLSVRIPRIGYRVAELPVIREYPPHGSIPTKMTGFKNRFELIKILGRLALGKYNPQL